MNRFARTTWRGPLALALTIGACGILIGCRTPIATRPLTANDVFFYAPFDGSLAAAQVELRPDWSALKIAAPVALVDAYNENLEKVPLENGVVHFTVKARNFRAFVADPMPSAAKKTP